MILIDNTVLSNFSLIHQPESIHQAFFEDVATTEHVLHEFERGYHSPFLKLDGLVKS